MPDDALLRPDTRAFRQRPPAMIGAFTIRATSNELVGPQGVVRLRPRLMDVLLRLAATPGEVVPRQVLLDEVWPRRLVADEVLSRTIAELRTALADDAREARYIETLPKVGYRLIAAVAGPPLPFAHAVTPLAHAHEPPVAAGAAPGVDAAAPARAPWHRRRYALPVLAAILALVAVGFAWRPARVASDPTAALQQQLTGANAFSSDLAMEMAPRFSPDGTRVAFALGDMEHAQIVVQDVATRTRTLIGDPSILQLAPVFFPDGQRIAYYRRQGKSCAIVERALATSTERVLVDCAQSPAARFDIAPDGSKLVFASFRERDTGLRLLDLATGRIAALTLPDASAGNDIHPRFSPDGSEVAFMRGLLGARDLWVVPVADPLKARAIGSPKGQSWGIAWLGPTGPLLVSADWLGFRALNVIDLAHGKVTLAGARGAQFPDVSARGDIVYEAAAYQANLQLVDVAAPERPPRTLWPSAKYTNYPQFSPDGRQIVDMSNRDNSASIFVGIVGQEARRLPPPADSMFGQAHWSQDGRFLYAVQARMEGAETVTRGVRIDPESGAVTRIAAIGDGVIDLRDSADGRLLYFATQDGPLMQLWRAPADAPEQRERLALPKVMDYDLQGNRLVYAEPQRGDLTVCELPALVCAPAGLPERDGRVGFALAGDGLWVGYYGEPGETVRFDLARHAITQRLSRGPSAVGQNLAVSPDERNAVLSVQEPPAIDLMLAPRASGWR